jgi:acetyl-CoA carboxylase carboxyl transferase subunit beta
MLDRFVELHGDRESGDDPAIVTGLGALCGRPIAVVGMERGHGEEAARRRQGRPMPEGYRKAQRVMRLATRFGLPLLTVIDTPGAYPGIEAEERGLAGEIAESMALMSELPVPIVAAVVGEGGSGGALALAVADRVLMQEGAIYSVIAPEGAAAILYRDAARAPELAEKLKITAVDLLGFGIVDAVVPEPDGGAAVDPDAAATLLQSAVEAAFAELRPMKRAKLLQGRTERYRSIGRDLVVKTPPIVDRPTGKQRAAEPTSKAAEPAPG